MAWRTVLLAAACAAALAVPAGAQAPAPPVIAPPPPVLVPRPPKPPETWDELPSATKVRLERQVRALAFQPVLKIEPFALPPEPRFVEAGTELFRQAITPARAVRLTSAPRRDYYGSVGSVLWQFRDGEVEYWCRISDFNLSTGHNYYCFLDRDADGTFDALYEAPYPWGYIGFTNFSLGKDEDLRKPVTYAPAEPPSDRREHVSVRYKGVFSGLIADDGFVRPGRVQFELIISAEPGPGGITRGQRLVRTYDVDLDSRGQAQVVMPSGYRVTIDKVEVGGRARIAVTGGMPAGEGYLLPALTREQVFTRYREALAAPPPPMPLPPIPLPPVAKPQP